MRKVEEDIIRSALEYRKIIIIHTTKYNIIGCLKFLFSIGVRWGGLAGTQLYKSHWSFYRIYLCINYKNGKPKLTYSHDVNNLKYYAGELNIELK